MAWNLSFFQTRQVFSPEHYKDQVSVLAETDFSPLLGQSLFANGGAMSHQYTPQSGAVSPLEATIETFSEYFSPFPIALSCFRVHSPSA